MMYETIDRYDSRLKSEYGMTDERIQAAKDDLNLMRDRPLMLTLEPRIGASRVLGLGHDAAILAGLMLGITPQRDEEITADD